VKFFYNTRFSCPVRVEERGYLLKKEIPPISIPYSTGPYCIPYNILTVPGGAFRYVLYVMFLSST
jgi:hypothetical protein